VKSQFIVLLELVVVLNKGIYGKKIINVCCNLKRGLYLGTKKNKRGVILRDGGSILVLFKSLDLGLFLSSLWWNWRVRNIVCVDNEQIHIFYVY